MSGSRVKETDPLKRDFRNFLWLIWKFLNLPQPTPVQYRIAYYLQHGPKRRIIMAFRGVGKSWITAAYVLWRLYCNPNLRILVVSASKERADQFSIFVKRLINEVPELAHLKAQEGQRDSMLAFDVGPAAPDQSPSVKSAGIFGQITGSRADEIVADDIEIPRNSATEDMRHKLAEAVKEFDAILKPGKESRVTYLGTPQTEMSLYTTKLASRGYDTRIWPAQVPTGGQVTAYGPRLAPDVAEMIEKGVKPGTPTDPRRFTSGDLLERETSYGRAGYELQFMLNTSLSDAERYPLKLRDLVIMNLNPELAPVKVAWGASPDLICEGLPNLGLDGDRFYRPFWQDKDTVTPYTGCVMAIDPSGRGKDETAYAVVKFLHGYQFLVAAGGFAGGYDEATLQALKVIARTHKVKEVVVEENFGGGMFTQLLRQAFAKPDIKNGAPVAGTEYPVGMVDLNVTGQKELRIIDTLEPVLMQHRLIVDEQLIKADYESGGSEYRYSLFYQLTRITKDRGALAHDDRLDALAHAVGYWAEHMSRNQAKAVLSVQEALLQKELKAFARQQLGRSTPARAGWISIRR